MPSESAFCSSQFLLNLGLLFLFCIWLAALLKFLFWIVYSFILFGFGFDFVLLLETWCMGFFFHFLDVMRTLRGVNLIEMPGCTC